MKQLQRQQRTVAQTAIVEGFGFWNSRDVRIEFHPASPNSGIVFLREDHDPPRRIEAAIEHRVEVPRRTNLTNDTTHVEMIEHVMAALAGLRIDNCEVRVSGPEMPGTDGSSLPITRELEAAGIEEQDAIRERIVVDRVLRVGDADSWIEARPAPLPGMFVKYQLDYWTEETIGRQAIEMQITPDSFCRELAPARTFLLESEALAMREQGIGQRATMRDLLVFGPDGPIDNTLRFRDECVRHKLIDLLGETQYSERAANLRKRLAGVERKFIRRDMYTAVPAPI